MTRRGNQQERLSTRDRLGYFLAGFVEGEGSFTVQVRLHPGTKFGIAIDPEFYLYQHQKRRKILDLAQEFFQTGKIWKKPGTENVLVYGIKSRRSIVEKVVPFVEKYLLPYTSRKEQIEFFLNVLKMLEEKKHHTKEGILEIVDYIYSTERKFRLPKSILVERILRGHTLDRP